VRISSVSGNRLVLSVVEPKVRFRLVTGEPLRVSTADHSGIWTLRATVVTPLLLGRPWLSVDIEGAEQQTQRRAEPRYRVQMPIRISIGGLAPRELIGRSENLSLGGVCFETAHAMAKDLAVTVTLSLDTGRTLTIRGNVVGSFASPRTPNRFVIGVHFVKLLPMIRLALERFLSEKGRSLGC
jgi:PilZ domain